MELKVDIVTSPIRSKSDCIQIDRVFHSSSWETATPAPCLNDLCVSFLPDWQRKHDWCQPGVWMNYICWTDTAIGRTRWECQSQTVQRDQSPRTTNRQLIIVYYQQLNGEYSTDGDDMQSVDTRQVHQPQSPDAWQVYHGTNHRAPECCVVPWYNSDLLLRTTI